MRQAVRISYDREADALYIRLPEGKFDCRNVRLTDLKDLLPRVVPA